MRNWETIYKSTMSDRRWFESCAYSLSLPLCHGKNKQSFDQLLDLFVNNNQPLFKSKREKTQAIRIRKHKNWAHHIWASHFRPLYLAPLIAVPTMHRHAYDQHILRGETYTQKWFLDSKIGSKKNWVVQLVRTCSVTASIKVLVFKSANNTSKPFFRR